VANDKHSREQETTNMTQQSAPENTPDDVHIGEGTNVRSWPVVGALVGMRVDLALGHCAGLSRSEAKRALEERRVRLGDKRILKPSDKGLLLFKDQKLSLEGFTKATDLAPTPQSVEGVHVLAEGPGWVVVHKPVGVPVHPLNPSQTQTALNHVAMLYPQINAVGEAGLRAGVVHRLDVETSGVLLFAYEQQTWLKLREAFKTHQTQKLYRALVHGRVNQPHADAKMGQRLSLDLAITSHHPARVRVVTPERMSAYKPSDVRACSLIYTVLKVNAETTLLEIDLLTGFLHQIRVMLSHIGHPVVNDGLYAPDLPASLSPASDRLMLHARELTIPIMGIHAVSPGPSWLELG
jgi:23S rRNA pseudouridine1911/1915/1917 synthase